MLSCQLYRQIYQLLQPYKNAELILIGSRSSRKIRQILWKYLTKLSQVKPILNGNDLQKLGYQPSPMYKQILDDLLAATLDGKITNKQEAKIFIQEKYPVLS